MRKIYLLLLAVFSSTAMFAQQNVTFQVDMKNETVGGSVYVAGSFNSWNSTANPLTQVGTSTIYSTTVSVANGNYEFKFINGSSWENPPNTCTIDGGYGGGNGNGNRWVAVWSDTTLPAILYNDCAPDGMSSIQFMVDMSTQSTVSDTVSVAGSFQGWSPGTTIMADITNDSIYRAMGYVGMNDTVAFKYLNGAAWGTDEAVPSACAVNNNREVIASANTNSGPICFGQCVSCFIPDTFNITFRVDMQNVCGFTSDSVDIAGTLNGWSGGQFLTDPDNDDIFEFSVDVPEGEIQYKIRFIENGATTWEGGNNKKVQLESDTVLDVRCFGLDTYGACTPKPDPSDIRFVVDVTNYSDPNVTLSDIYLEGDFTDPTWQGGAILMTPVSGMPGVYETTVNGICPARINFKFLNGDPSGQANDPNGYKEEDFAGITDSSCIEPSGVGGYNRVFIRPDDQPQTLAFVWNSCSVVPGIGIEEASVENISVYPNPSNGEVNIELSENETYNINLTDITGTRTYTRTNVSGTQVIEKGNLSPGVYILKIDSDSQKTKTTKLVIQ